MWRVSRQAALMSPSHPVPDSVARLLAEQSGLATRAQLRTHGMSSPGLRQQLERAWRRVLPRVVLASRSPLTDHQRLVAALLFAGEGAVVSGLTAALWHGVRAAAVDRRVHVTIPSHRCVADHAFVVVHRTRRPDVLAWRRGPLVISSPARAVADAARDAGEPAARAIVLEAVPASARRGSRAPARAPGRAESGCSSSSQCFARSGGGRVVCPRGRSGAPGREQ